MIKLTIDIEAMSKPRGMLSPTGKKHIYHSSPKYKSWKRRFTREVSKLPITSDHFIGMYSLVFHIYYQPKGGRYPDGENMQGAIQDALTSDLMLIPDDSIKYIDDWKGKVFIGKEDKIVLFICYSKNDLIKVITDYE